MSRHLYHCPSKKDWAVFYSESKISQRDIPSFFFFEDRIKITPQEVLTACALNQYLPEWFREALTARYDQAEFMISEKFRKRKCQSIQESKLPAYAKASAGKQNFQRFKVSNFQTCEDERQTRGRETTCPRAYPNYRGATPCHRIAAPRRTRPNHQQRR